MDALKKRIIAAVAVVAGITLIGATSYAALQRNNRDGVPRGAVRAQVVRVSNDTVINRVSLRGVVEIAEKTSVFSQNDARVTEVCVKPADFVEEGDTLLLYSLEGLFELDMQLQDISLQLDAARLNLTEAERLSGQSALKEAEIAVSRLELREEQILGLIEAYVIEECAPVSGTLLSVSALPGGYVSRTVPFAEIADLGTENLRITVNVPEQEASGIKTGQVCEITGGILGNEVIIGSVSDIDPFASVANIGGVQETVIRVTLAFDDTTGQLRPGNTVSVDIITGEYENVAVIPLAATFSYSDGKEYVYVIDNESAAVMREVTILAFDGMKVAVRGVEEGEAVIAAYSPRIMDGDKVRVAE